MPTAQARLGEASATPKSSLSKELGLGDGTTVQFPQAATDAVPGPSPISATAITSGAVTTRTPYPASIPNAPSFTCSGFPSCRQLCQGGGRVGL
jgi:hypothetical protein